MVVVWNILIEIIEKTERRYVNPVERFLKDNKNTYISKFKCIELNNNVLVYFCNSADYNTSGNIIEAALSRFEIPLSVRNLIGHMLASRRVTATKGDTSVGNRVTIGLPTERIAIITSLESDSI